MVSPLRSQPHLNLILKSAVLAITEILNHYSLDGLKTYQFSHWFRVSPCRLVSDLLHV